LECAKVISLTPKLDTRSDIKRELEKGSFKCAQCILYM
jgi:hypothetical protein